MCRLVGRVRRPARLVTQPQTAPWRRSQHFIVVRPPQPQAATTRSMHTYTAWAQFTTALQVIYCRQRWLQFDPWPLMWAEPRGAPQCVIAHRAPATGRGPTDAAGVSFFAHKLCISDTAAQVGSSRTGPDPRDTAPHISYQYKRLDATWRRNCVRAFKRPVLNARS